jgi:hypothetical protein
MSLLKYIDRVKRMDNLIRLKATGCANEFASKLGISPSQLFQDLKEMKQLGAPIQYCSVRKSYVYESNGRLTIDFMSDGQHIKGGKNIFNFNLDSSIAGAAASTLQTHIFEC